MSRVSKLLRSLPRAAVFALMTIGVVVREELGFTLVTVGRESSPEGART
jgi:hypothetical protein